jgi:hypothetical protein
MLRLLLREEALVLGVLDRVHLVDLLGRLLARAGALALLELVGRLLRKLLRAGKADRAL